MKRDNRTTHFKPDKLWEADCILQERWVRGNKEYLIQWQGIDLTTEEKYLPTWEPESSPNESLLASWTTNHKRTEDLVCLHHERVCS
jgi:hypothetical protein